MSVRERILALRLLEKQKKNSELAKQIGIQVEMKRTYETSDIGGIRNGNIREV